MNKWTPHRPKDWPWRYATTKIPLKIPSLDRPGVIYSTELPAGSRVKVVMASRLGDIGVTANLEAEYGYAVRVSIDKIEATFDKCNNEREVP